MFSADMPEGENTGAMAGPLHDAATAAATAHGTRAATKSEGGWTIFSSVRAMLKNFFTPIELCSVVLEATTEDGFLKTADCPMLMDEGQTVDHRQVMLCDTPATTRSTEGDGEHAVQL